MFFEWLIHQRERTDDVGRLAAFISLDKHYPRKSHRLYMLLKYCGEHAELRRLMKIAHAEWRQVRDRASIKISVSASK